MNESEFLNASDQIFDRIENGLDDGEFDVDLNRNGNVLEIEFDDGAKIVVNRHAANQEIWLAGPVPVAFITAIRMAAGAAPAMRASCSPNWPTWYWPTPRAGRNSRCWTG